MGKNTLQYDVEELYRWIDNYALTRPKRNISRDFSDAVPLAEILKQHYPKLVDLHNYTPRNSVSQKLINWQTLNKKVLSKLEMTLSNTVMEQLSQSTPQIIEKVLFDIKNKIEAKLSPVKNDSYILEGLSSSLSGSVIPIRQKDGTKVLDHKVIPMDEFKNMENDLQEKDHTINNLTNKVEHLESLLTIKDQRIKDLTLQIQRISSNDSSVSSLTLMKGGSKLLNRLF